jgi:NAD(P)-dependent dehydrogenase (short-subunit alcohol dehydrogenase family)
VGMYSKKLFRVPSALQRLRLSFTAPRRSVSTGSLVGQKCIITGASRGIGKAIAQRFAKEGASCTLVARNKSALDELAATLSPSPQDSGYHVHLVKAGNVGDRGFWESLARESVCAIASRVIRLGYC